MTDDRRAFLERQARTAVVRERERRHNERWTEEDVRRIKIQTTSPWRRIFVGVSGLSTLVGGLIVAASDVAWLGVVLALFGAALVVVAIRGKKRSIEAAFDGIDFLYIFDGLIDW